MTIMQLIGILEKYPPTTRIVVRRLDGYFSDLLVGPPTFISLVKIEPRSDDEPALYEVHLNAPKSIMAVYVVPKI